MTDCLSTYPPAQRESGMASLEVELVYNQSTVTGAYATSPMKLLTPRSRGQSVLAYASNFGGGLVAGDQTRLDLRVGKGARCFVSTQASTKIYRNPCRLPCEHVTRAGVESGAVLVFAPAPIQPFADSSYCQKQEFHLASEAGLVLLDWVTSGRTATGERWAFAHLASRNEIWQSGQLQGSAIEEARVASNPHEGPVGGRCIFLDALSLDPSDGPLVSAYRTGRFNCFAILVLAGTPFQQKANDLLREVSSLPTERRGALLVTASPIQTGAVLRVAGEDFASVENWLRRHFASLSNVLGDDPWVRKY